MQTAGAVGGGPLKTLFGFTKALVLCPNCNPKSQKWVKWALLLSRGGGGLSQGGRHAGGGPGVGEGTQVRGADAGWRLVLHKGARLSSTRGGRQPPAVNAAKMQMCHQVPVLAGSVTLATMGTLTLCSRESGSYGKHIKNTAPFLPARVAWFLQELPAFVVSVGMLAWQPHSLFGPPGNVLLGLFSIHYFHRLAFHLRSAAPCSALAHRRTSRGQRAQRGGAQNGADLGCPMGARRLPGVGKHQWNRSPSLERRSDAGWGKLGNSDWAGAATGQGASFSNLALLL